MDELTSKLTTIFHNVNSWLKFAETKNAVALAFSGAGFTATLTFLSASQNLYVSLKISLIVATSLLCISSLISCFSFLPRTNLGRFLWLKTKPFGKSVTSPTDNFYYFGDLRKYHSNEFLDSLNKFYFENKIVKPYSKECEDLAAQVIINSEITYFKGTSNKRIS